ncbi:beta strand repeat-containing protein, partial [Flagellimonas okinawensis]
MKKSILALLFLLFTGIAFSQTTVTLQDQCNCEVLKGTDVTSSGALTPTGADLGDIYVNTNTGTIYFWDGDSWELTATDDQQLTGFTFDEATNILSLSLEDGGNVNVDLSSLKDVLTDSNTTVTSFDIDGTNTNLVITDSEANTFAVALADLAALIDTNTDNQDLTGATLNGSNQLQIDIQNGASATVDLSSLDNSAGVAANASAISTNTGNITTNATNISDNASDIATNTAAITTNASNITSNTSNITANTNNIATNASDISDNASDIETNTAAITTNATAISANATDISDHIAADGDLSSTNEIQNIEQVLTESNDANGLVITGLGTPTAGSDAATKAYVDSMADDDITGASLDAPSNVLTISEGTTDVTVDLSDLDDSAGVAANASAITTNATNISDNASDIATNTAAISTNASNITSNTSNITANTNNIATNASDISDNVTDISTNTGNITTNATNISDNASDIATNTAAITTNATAISANATDIADHIAADGDLSSTNEIQNIEQVLTESNDANGLVITGLGTPTAGSDAATKAYVDSMADDDITGASLDAPSNVLTISEGTTDVTVDLSDLDDSAGVAANASAITTNATNISDNTSDIATNTAAITTNASNITSNTSNITANTNNIATNASDISDNATAISTNTGNITTNATAISANATDIADHIAADGDLSSTNEIQNLGEVLADGNDGGGAAITNIADPTNAQDAATKAYVDSMADDDITGASLDAPSNVLTISEGTTDVTVDLS